MKEFLKTVAEHYYAELSAEGHGAVDPLGFTRYLFVFPNRRSGLIFNHYLASFSSRPLMAPEMTTISELFSHFSDVRVADRLTLLFRLYVIYREVSRSNEEFDSFVFWGDMLLGDFNDVDKYLADARQVFYNVRDLKEIEAEFEGYSDEVMSVIRQFWNNFNPSQQKNHKEIFRETWGILYELYTKFRQSLAADGMAYEGMQQRDIVERLMSDAESMTDVLAGRKIVFVGLTAISKVDRRLMAWLQKHRSAEFCWDYADPRLQAWVEDSVKGRVNNPSRAAYFTAANMTDFPNAIDEEEMMAGLVPDSEREVEVIAIPSGVGQAVQARRVLRRWIDQKIVDVTSKDKNAPANAFHTAVVLPDENMLLPVLYAVPKELGAFNVTTGYSLKLTSVAAFVDALSRMQSEARYSADTRKVTFYYQSVLPVLSHNYVTAIAGQEALAITQRIRQENLYQVPADVLTGHRLLELLFKRVTSASSMVRYLQQIFAYLAKQAEADAQDESQEELMQEDLFSQCDEDGCPQMEDDSTTAVSHVFSPVEREFLYSYAKMVDRLGELVEEYGRRYSLDFHPSTFFHLLRKLTLGISVPFTGEPLAGLQVMGVLETRALDFDNIIVLSMNEGVFPAKPVNNTFIPYSLRHAFDLPTQEHRDAVFAYHFYRLLSRAHRVTLIYDSRTDGMKTGEPSRYLKQMHFLYGFDMTPSPVDYPVTVTESQGVVVKKTEAIMDTLTQFLRPHGRHLSATALKAYISCPMRFYLAYVKMLSQEDEIAEGIDSSQFGSAFHATMQALYKPYLGKLVMADNIENLISRSDAEIEQALCKALVEVLHLPQESVTRLSDLTGYLNIVAEIIKGYVISTLRHDKKLCPFTPLALEKKFMVPYRIDDIREVNIKSIYDRVDLIEKDHTLRIVDYKTASIRVGNQKTKLEFSSVEGLMQADGKCSEESFQVMLYSLLLDYISTADRASMSLDTSHRFSQVSPHLYFVREFPKEDSVPTELVFKPSKEEAMTTTLPEGPVTDFSRFREPFEKKLREVLTEIFDPSIPFGQCSDTGNCKYCLFKSVCNRE